MIRHKLRALLRGLPVLVLLGATTTALGQSLTAGPVDLAAEHLRTHHQSLGLTAQDVAESVLSSQSASRHNGISHVYFQQQLDGIDVLGGVINVNISRDDRVLSVGNRYFPNAASLAPVRVPTLSATEAIRRAAIALGVSWSGKPQLKQRIGGLSQRAVYAPSGVSKRDIPVRLVYLRQGSGVIRLAWDLAIETDQQHYWQVQVDANSGHVLRRRNYVLNHSYKVYGMPAEDPNKAAVPPPLDGRNLVVDPENAAASPAGWVSTVVTDGPNVQAQTDIDGNDVFTPGVDVKPQGTGSPGGSLVFDYPIDLTQGASTYREAVVTNLFYWNNVAHDVHELYGFDEVNFNFEGNDPVLADAQDDSLNGTANNANMLTLPDGTPPRMQMYVTTPPGELEVNSPYSAKYESGSASFGVPVPPGGITNDLVTVDDGAEPTNDACEPPPWASDVTGKIAFLDRGTCEFGTKILHAQQAGAIAAVLVNPQSVDPVAMGPGADGAAVTIPSVSIGKNAGNEIKDSIAAGNTVNVTLKPATHPNRDTDFDNGIILHEYGHGVSNRLAGGGVVVPFCLDGDQQAGEGWSDWWGLAFTQADANEPATGRGIGTYAFFLSPTGPGIRPFAYSTDMNVNPQTYGDLPEGRLTVPHGVGTVWATAAWEMYWALIRGVPELSLPARGFEPDIYQFDSGKGNTLALQYVMDGLKLGGCNPSMLDSRDAILLADEQNNDGENQCHIWWAFAKRGMGVNALSPPGGVENLPGLDVTEEFSMPFECTGICPPPLFGGVKSVVAPSSGDCQLIVSWDAGENNCDTSPISYDLYRSTDPEFIPAPENILAGDLTVTEHVDTSVQGGVEYFYVARARDGAGNAEQNLFRRSNIAAGSYSADPDGLLDDAGDTVRTFFAPANQPNGWTVREAGGTGGSKVYATSAGGNYPNEKCLFLESPIHKLGENPTLTFQSKWDLEPSWDGGIVEIATEAGGFNDWAKLTDILYPGAMLGEPLLFTTTCTNPGMRDGEPAFTGTSGGNYLGFSSDLSVWSDQSIKIRFVFGSDAASDDLGWFVDDIGIDQLQIAEACLVNAPPVARAGADFEVNEGKPAELDGTASSDPENGVLSFAWAQAGGPTVSLVDSDTATPSFQAPLVDFDTDLIFELTVTDDGDLPGTDTVTVTVLKAKTAAPGTIDNNRLGGALSLLALGFGLAGVVLRRRKKVS